MTSILSKVRQTVRTKRFFYFVMAIFLLEAIWIAVSSRFPMAFDEAYHLGIIKIYSHQLNPIFVHQPAGPAPFGALNADPSYIYHYLMSFPYRWLSSGFSSQMLVIVLMRLINIGLFAGGLVLFRKLLGKSKASPGIINITLLFFVLVPVVPLLAAQNNYDNLLMLIVPFNMLLALKFTDKLKKKRLSWPLFLSCIAVGLLGSLVVFPYLPILTAITLYLLYKTIKFIRHNHGWKTEFKKSWKSGNKFTKIAAVIFFVLSAAMFLQRYGVAVVRYHNLIPQCGQVLGVERCQAYSPWARNYQYAHSKHGSTENNPLKFIGGWLSGMFDRSFFVINGPGDPASYENSPPPILLSITAIAVFGFGLLLLLWRGRRLLKGDGALLFMLFVSLVYLLALIGRNYHDYLQLGRLVAINGRYLVLIIMPIMLLIGEAYRSFVAKKHQTVLLGVVFVLFLQGGGGLSFIYFSNENWYRTDSETAVKINQTAHKIIHPLIFNP